MEMNETEEESSDTLTHRSNLDEDEILLENLEWDDFGSTQQWDRAFRQTLP